MLHGSPNVFLMLIPHDLHPRESIALWPAVSDGDLPGIAKQSLLFAFWDERTFTVANFAPVVRAWRKPLE